MKKSKFFLKLFFCSTIFVLSHSILLSQEFSKNNFLGKWQWVNGNRDTFQIVFKPLRTTLIDSVNRDIRMFGYHSYVEKGVLVESSLLAVSDTGVTRHTTVFGKISDGQMSLSLRDLTRDNTFYYRLHLIHSNPNIAWLEYVTRDHRWITEQNKRLYPPGKTIPSDIVLKKISDTY